jgi:beta-glucanase (GH16 family)
VHALPSAPAVGESGVSVPIGNLPGWRQIFTDEFTTNVALGSFPDAVSGKWGAYPSPWKDTSGNGVYSPKEVVSVTNGVLTEDIHTSNGVHKVAALTPKVPGSASFGQQYGRYEVRMRTDSLPGYKLAWMLWPDSGTTTTGASGGGGNGEIDFPEGELSTSSQIWGFVHRQNATTGGDQAWFKIPVNTTAWHTYTFEWSPGLVRLLLDGAEVGRTTERIPNTAMHWVLQTETSLKTAPPVDAEINVMIDWVAAWGYAP